MEEALQQANGRCDDLQSQVCMLDASGDAPGDETRDAPGDAPGDAGDAPGHAPGHASGDAPGDAPGDAKISREMHLEMLQEMRRKRPQRRVTPAACRACGPLQEDCGASQAHEVSLRAPTCLLWQPLQLTRTLTTPTGLLWQLLTPSIVSPRLPIMAAPRPIHCVSPLAYYGSSPPRSRPTATPRRSSRNSRARWPSA
eukprot:6442635-Prymnesium_polylepis.1